MHHKRLMMRGAEIRDFCGAVRARDFPRRYAREAILNKGSWIHPS